ncbi:atherin-like [Phacochoerus africanus]|uniref:atherin-like n=1 Tax=Phacochoerus africanus TaxID=41426 RepID=UPI001FD8B119|nr:atherin-like [Phacochoerus africanus]
MGGKAEKGSSFGFSRESLRRATARQPGVPDDHPFQCVLRGAWGEREKRTESGGRAETLMTPPASPTPSSLSHSTSQPGRAGVGGNPTQVCCGFPRRSPQRGPSPSPTGQSTPARAPPGRPRGARRSPSRPPPNPGPQRPGPPARQARPPAQPAGAA